MQTQALHTLSVSGSMTTTVTDSNQIPAAFNKHSDKCEEFCVWFTEAYELSAYWESTVSIPLEGIWERTVKPELQVFTALACRAPVAGTDGILQTCTQTGCNWSQKEAKQTNAAEKRNLIHESCIRAEYIRGILTTIMK